MIDWGRGRGERETDSQIDEGGSNVGPKYHLELYHRRPHGRLVEDQEHVVPVDLYA